MKNNELAWRTLVDNALEERRRWESIDELAFKAGIPRTTAHLSLQRLSDIGAITTYPSGGFSVTSPDKILTLLCAWRNLTPDTVVMTTHDGVNAICQQHQLTHAWSGPDAAIHYLGGRNTVADYSSALIYVQLPTDTNIVFPEGNDVRVLTMDARAALDWDGYASFAQTYADLFASPGWQSTEFRLALRDRFLSTRDWDQKEANRG